MQCVWGDGQRKRKKGGAEERHQIRATTVPGSGSRLVSSADRFKLRAVMRN